MAERNGNEHISRQWVTTALYRDFLDDVLWPIKRHRKYKTLQDVLLNHGQSLLEELQRIESETDDDR